MKKLLSLVLVAMLVMACFATVASAEWKFERRVELVCPWGAGGGADTTLRTIAAELEKAGIQNVVNNVEGAGGVKGTEYTHKQPADGYTFQLGTNSLILADLQGLLSFDFQTEMIPVTRFVFDTNVLIAGKNAPYNNMAELVEYVKANPGKAQCGVLTITGQDAMSVVQTFKESGVEVPLVAFSGGAELNAAIVGGHVDLMVAGPAESKGLIESGDMKPIVAFSEQRLNVLPDVECTGELGIKSFIGPYRGLFAVKGTPQEAIDAMAAALKAAVETESFKTWAASVGLDARPGYQDQATFQQTITDDYVTLRTLAEETGVKVVKQ